MENRNDLAIRAEMAPLIVKGLVKSMSGRWPEKEVNRLNELSAERRQGKSETDA